MGAVKAAPLQQEPPPPTIPPPPLTVTQVAELREEIGAQIRQGQRGGLPGISAGSAAQLIQRCLRYPERFPEAWAMVMCVPWVSVTESGIDYLSIPV